LEHATGVDFVIWALAGFKAWFVGVIPWGHGAARRRAGDGAAIRLRFCQRLVLARGLEMSPENSSV
jgi:hypothetical protein